MTTLGRSSESDLSVADISVDGDAQEEEFAARTRALEAASVLIVNVSPAAPASLLDSAVTSAIDHEQIHSVVLTAVQSLDEAKLVRNLLLKSRYSNFEESHHRRLNNNNNNQQQQQNNASPNDVYYTSTTPNIFAGIMFFFFFIFIAYIGVSCMNQISGQDFYVQKYPVIGREA
jgi:hypothetical protein